MKFKKFKIKDVFRIKKVYGQPLSKYIEGDTPYVTGAQNNNGLVGYVNADEKDISDGKCISVDPIKGFACWQPNSFVGRGFSGASINLLYNDNLNEKRALFVCAAIEKVSLKVASYSLLLNSSRLENTEIMLPVITPPQENSEEFLPNWTVLQQMLDGGGSMNNIDTSRWKKFSLLDLFGIPKRGTRLVKEKRIKGDIPLITAGYNNSGVAEYVSNSEQNIFKHGFTIDMFGNCFYRDYKFMADDNILVFDDNSLSREIKLFIAACINNVTKNIYSYSKQFRQNSYNETYICLPAKIKSQKTEIDWDFMEKYIKAIEKKVIRDVVLYKNRVIEETKKVVGDGNDDGKDKEAEDDKKNEN